ncbi:MAG: carboxyl-terminal processing protease [Actinomycetota bacterium]|nr:carboxyl-terminal processing protease [Actinomycetota bacterium]MEA2487031.1 carboxyl-terminal processing protease [Actinomycetota bacterium]
MERWQKVLFVTLAVFLIATATFAAGVALGRRTDITIPLVGGGSTGTSLIDQAYNTIRSSAVKPPDADALTQAAIKGMVSLVKKSGDPYAFFFSPKSFKDFEQLTTGQFSGIGVWLKSETQGLTIVSVLPSTPASHVGLKRGDIIRSIDGKAVKNLTSDQAIALIKGPAGTDVTLGIDRAQALLSFTVTRQTISLPVVRSHAIGSDLGYVRLFEFSKGAADQVRQRVQSLVDGGAKGIVLDLRDNGGGLFQEGIDVASIFIEDGKIVTYKEHGKDPITYNARGDAFEHLPLVVLVNGGTASAAEIVTGALQDRNRAVIVGTKTYGKGSVQNVIPLPDSAAFKLTIGAYYTPSGRNFTGNGIDPDVKVNGSDQAQQRRAVGILQGLVGSG